MPRFADPYMVSRAQVKYYLLAYETLSGEEVERIVLVSACLNDDEVFPAATRVAENLV